MATFSPVSDIWTLRYDQFGGIFWQNSATQELHYIPPGQPPTLPPRSLANGIRPNLPNNLPVTPASTVHPPQHFGGTVHFNNPALRVPETAREGPVSFVGCPQPHPSPSMWTEDGNHRLPPWGLANAPRRYFPDDPYSTFTVTARAQAPPLVAGGTGVHFNNSALEEPEAARLRPASPVESMESYLRPPMSRTNDATRGLPPTSSANAPLPNLPPETHPTATADDRAEASLLQGGGEGGKFDPSARMIPETAGPQLESITEDKEHYPSLPVARVGEEKHRLSAKRLSNAPRSNVSNHTPFTPDAAVGAEASSIWGNDEREQFGKNSVLGLSEAMRLRPESVADKKPQPSLQMARVGNAKHGLPAKRMSNAPRSNVSNHTPFTSDPTVGAEASLIRGTGEREQFGNKSGLGIPGAMRLRPAPIAEDKVPYPSTLMSRTEETKHELPRKALVDISSPNLPPESHLTISAKHRAKASLRRGAEEGGQLDPSGLKVSETARLLPESTAENKNPHPSLTMVRVGDVKHGLSAKRLSNAPRSNISNDSLFTPDITGGAEASLIRSQGDGEREQFSNNSTLKVPAGVELRPKSISEDTKPRPSPLVSTAEDAKHESSLKRLSNAPRRNIIEDSPFNTTASAHAEAALLWASGGRGQFDNNSALEIPDTSSEYIVGTNPRSSASSMSRAEEAKQWSRTRDNQGKEYYFNIITGESQSKKPDCLKKYTCR